MSRSRPNFARKYRPPATDPTSVANPADPRSAHGELRREASVLLGASLLLRADQAERLSEFQRWHVQAPALCLTDARSIMCPVLGADAQPLCTSKGQSITSRIILEVASCGGARSPHGASAGVRWYFVAWDARGRIAHMSTYPKRKAALAMFNRPAECLAISDRGMLVALPISSAFDMEGVGHE